MNWRARTPALPLFRRTLRLAGFRTSASRGIAAPSRPRINSWPSLRRPPPGDAVRCLLLRPLCQIDLKPFTREKRRPARPPACLPASWAIKRAALPKPRGDWALPSSLAAIAAINSTIRGPTARSLFISTSRQEAAARLASGGSRAAKARLARFWHWRIVRRPPPPTLPACWDCVTTPPNRSTIAAASCASVRFCMSAGLPVPDFFAFPLAEPLDSVLRRVSFPCVVKPLRLAASQGVIRANDSARIYRRGRAHRAIARFSRACKSTREGRSRSLARRTLHSRSGSCRSKAFSTPAACGF